MLDYGWSTILKKISERHSSCCIEINSIAQAIRLTSKEGKIGTANASIDVFKDGGAYELPSRLEFSYEDAMAYSRVAMMEKVVIKQFQARSLQICVAPVSLIDNFFTLPSPKTGSIKRT